MRSLVRYQRRGPVATIAMDDGKVNVLSSEMFAELAGALDRARADGCAVILTGREGVFSAGFDRGVLGAGGREAHTMVRSGFELAERLFGFPAPVVIACTGHAIAMGAFLVLSGDHRLGAAGAYTIGANEVAIGITMPFFGIEICRQRLAPAHFHRAVINAEMYGPEDAVAAGFLDRVVPAAELANAAEEVAAALARFDREVHTASKRRARASGSAAIRAAIEADDAAFRTLFAAPAAP